MLMSCAEINPLRGQHIKIQSELANPPFATSESHNSVFLPILFCIKEISKRSLEDNFNSFFNDAMD